MAQITTIIFDIGGVIYRAGDGPPLREKWASRCNLSHEEFDNVVFRDPLFAQAVIGKISNEDLWARKNETLKLSDAELEELLVDYWGGYWDAELLAYIETELKPHYKVGIISDANTGAREAVAPHINFDLFDSVVFSYEVGMAKPDPKIFHLALDRLRAKPEETIFIDDHRPIIDAANEIGIHGIVYTEFDSLFRSLKKRL
ncbi:MAG: HAD-IA family hydrolase [Chloroflexota bacterium]